MQLSNHAHQRSRHRNIPRRAVEVVCRLGRSFYIPGARVYVVGRVEVRKFEAVVDLSDLEGTVVICSPDGRVVKTTYRDRDLRVLRQRK